MPRSGGEADKIGNQFESVWTVHTLLDVFDGRLLAITVEPLGDEARGLEFYVDCNNGSRQFHSVKRQKQGGDWSIADLCRPDSTTRRSVLGDLADHSLSDSGGRACFVSSTGANQLRELCERATALTNVSDFRRSLPPARQHQFDQRIVPLCKCDERRAFKFLQHLEVTLHSHQHLVETVERRLSALFYNLDRSMLDPGDLRRAIAEFVMSRLGSTIDGEQFRAYLHERRVGSRDWTTDPTIAGLVTKINTNYSTIVETELINATHIKRDILDEIISGVYDSNSKGALIVAPGGFGKSCVIAQTIACVAARGTPFLSVRMDAFTQSTTARQLGKQLDLPASPAVVLAGMADNTTSVLVVDQLDALSLVSGRNPQMWMAFNDLWNDVRSYPHMKMILACRDFDLKHDHRLRPLAEPESGFAKYALGRLNPREIVDSLKAAGFRVFVPSDRQLEVLSIPFHLLLFVQGRPSLSFTGTGQLYDAYWRRKIQNLKERIGRDPRWNEVIDSLTGRMSADQALFAPQIIVDDWRSDAEAMVSEHVLVDVADQGQYRFFHESFFDYAYARRFVSAGRNVIDLLSETEQHLFRRSQVRQILEFLRRNDFSEYIYCARSVLGSERVRFHIKRMVASGLGNVDHPRQAEWELVEPLLESGSLSRYMASAILGRPGWFDLLNSNGTLSRWLGSEHSATVDRAVSFLESTELQDLRSSEIATLIRGYANTSATWQERIMKIMSWGKMHRSSETRSLHIGLLASGSYDEYSLPFSNTDYWHQYHESAEVCPAFVIDVLKIWFERAVRRFDDQCSWSFLDGFAQNRSYAGALIVQSVAEARPKYYVEQMLPVVTATVLRTEWDSDDMLNRLWPGLSNAGDPHSVDDAILLALRTALQHLAINDVESFRLHVTPILSYAHQTLGYLTLRAWQDNPQEFADECAQYLVEDSRRLRIGYGSWIGQGGGTGHCAIARRTIAATSPYFSDERFADLEAAILWYRDVFEEHHPNFRGHTELLLLRELDASRMSDTATRRASELERKFTDSNDDSVDEDVILQMSSIGPPIPSDRAHLMTDEQWMSAIYKHDASIELSRVLMELARSHRRRFASLALRMGDDIFPTYFSAILDGLSGRFANGKSATEAEGLIIREVESEVFLDVIDRVHRLPGKPCGTSIAHCIRVLSDRDLPLRTLDTISYYAIHDPNPNEDLWRRDAGGGIRYYGGDPYQYGINCVRGQAAAAIQSLLYSDNTRLIALRRALVALCQDQVVSVRLCAVDALLPLLNFWRDLAVSLFVGACSGYREMWSTPPFESFLRYAVHTHYHQLRPVLQAALGSGDEKAAECAARQIALAELSSVDVGSDGAQVRTGSIPMRRAVAGIYARNVEREVVGPVCMMRLEPFLDDKDEPVRSEASTVLFDVSGEWLLRGKEFLLRFIESKAFESAPHYVLRALEDSNLALPHVICRAAERVLGFLGVEGTHIAGRGSMAASSLATLVVRQYQQTTDNTLKTRCLDLIDRMEEEGYFGIENELAKLER